AMSLGPPYVLVGHSWGGIVARLFAHAHSSATAGLVFVDATHEVIDSWGYALMPAVYSLVGLASRTNAGRRWLLAQLCPTGGSVEYRSRAERRINDRTEWRIALRTARAEARGIRPSLAQVCRECPDLPPIPCRVLTAGGPGSVNAKGLARVHVAW